MPEILLKNWIFRSPSPAFVEEIMATLKISRPAAEVLVNRGISSFTEARRFLYPDLENLANPFLLPDIMAAVLRIRRAIDRKEKILVYGDRDVDGVTSIAIVTRTLRSLGADPLWYIPSSEGYGIHRDVITRYAAEGVTLMITVDCGISAAAEIALAASMGIDTVVTDHHSIPVQGIPPALAVVDPKRADTLYPFSELAGCAVSFKVMQAVQLSHGTYFDEDLVFAAVLTAGEDRTPAGVREISALKTRNNIITDRMTVMFRPERAGGHDSHYEYVMDSLAQMRAFIGDARSVVCGPASGGMRLRELMRTALGPATEGPVIDLMDLARAAGRVETGLEELASGLGLESAMPGATEETGLLRRVFHALDRQNDARMLNFLDEHLDLIALGTIADIVPLTSENRVLVKEGLRRLTESKKAGVIALRDRCVRGDMTAKTISWNITPVLNSAGRRGKAHLAAELLQTDDPRRAEVLLDEIVHLNTERRELQAENMEKFNNLVRDQCDLENDKVLVVTGEQMEHGVTGIIASQILNRFGRPVVLLIKDGDEAVGAARSIDGFDMVEAFASMSELLTRHGGHSKAAGLTLPVKNIDEFCRRMRLYAEQKLVGRTLVPTVDIDSSLRSSQLNRDLMRELEQMSPFGMGNQYPVFVLPGIKVKEHTRVGSGGQHLKLTIARGDGTTISAFGWGLGSWDEDLKNFYSVDLAVQLELVTWVDKQVLQLLIMDIRPTKI